ncbi:MAG: ABC transporter ATP-binding protein [Rhizobiaceae bacterium]|nr:ABC transporter ATP-binding protein [Rhizobiaceae bacterium]
MTGPNGARLEIDNVTLRFGGIAAINGVSFSAEPGELVALVGPNGAGKTAMLNCINGIYRVTSGDIRLDGESIVGGALHRMVDRGIGRAFQHAELFPHLTVTENLLTGCHTQFRAGLLSAGIYFGKAKREEIARRARAEAIIDFFELYRQRDEQVGQLPYGVQKMVGVARALMIEPKLLLLDEPCTGLIREERENLARFLMRICHEIGPTVIWVEHDMQMVADLADRVVVMNFGAKTADGAPDEIRRDPEVIRAYLGQGVN